MPAPISAATLLNLLREHVGAEYVLTDGGSTKRFRKGYRYGEGPVLAVVRPGTLVELWNVFKTIVENGRIVILQAANTGLNGGSTPFGHDYDREIVLVNTLRLDRIDLLDNGRQVVCLPGATLHQLETRLRPFSRDPHSNIGSTSIGATVVGGVCNNSGGSLIRRGPAFTELALFARVVDDGSVALVNHLGIDLGSDAETILGRLDRGEYDATDIDHDPQKRASDPDYATLVRDIEAPLPARYNNDPRLLFEASGSAGKLCVFAVRLDTFASGGPSQTFYIGSNNAQDLTELRRHILARFENMPVAGEYMDRDAYELTERYGKDLYLLIKHAGTRRIPGAFALKSRFDMMTGGLGLGTNLSDRLLQFVTGLLPSHLPRRMTLFRDRFDHHLLLRMDGAGIAEARTYLKSFFRNGDSDFFECTEAEAAAAFRHRFAVGAASTRYRAIHRKLVEDVVALDIALPRNNRDWSESLPDEVQPLIVQKLLCGHFFCQVFHYDYAMRKGTDCLAVEHQIIAHLEGRGIEFPSEHNVGHLYKAKPVLAGFYRSLDPTNALNPGLGHTSRRKDWS